MTETSIEKSANGNGATEAPALWTVTPFTDVLENSDHYWLLLDVPGVEPASLDIQLVERSISVRARQVSSGAGPDAPIAEFRRVVHLPQDVDAANVTAEFDRGVLDIRVPKAASARRVRVPVALK